MVKLYKSLEDNYSKGKKTPTERNTSITSFTDIQITLCLISCAFQALCEVGGIFQKYVFTALISRRGLSETTAGYV